MKIWKIAAIAVAIVVVVVLAAIGGMAFIVLDVMSNTATGSETLTPTGEETGKALVVYDPGVSGTAKTAAGKIAADLQAKGYTVELAGVKSQAAAEVSGYDVIIVGGPTYVGNLSSSAKAYLEDLDPSTDATIGVFTTGGVEPSSNDAAHMLKFVTGLSEDNPLKVKSVVKLLSSDDTDKKCADFVSALLQ